MVDLKCLIKKLIPSKCNKKILLKVSQLKKQHLLLKAFFESTDLVRLKNTRWDFREEQFYLLPSIIIYHMQHISNWRKDLYCQQHLPWNQEDLSLTRKDKT